MTTGSLLQVRDLRVTFHVAAGSFNAVADVDLDLSAGETLGLIGESGSGKSTTARAIAQLPPPDAGSVRFGGSELTRTRGRELAKIRRGLGIVFQDPIASLNPRRTVADIIALPMRVGGVRSRQERQRRTSELLDLVGLPKDFTERRPHELSGGQCQRVSIARALAADPQILICDEVVSSLDVSVQAQIINLLLDIRDRTGLAMLFIAHDLAVVRQLCDRVAVMYLGRICEVGSTDQLFEHSTHPYTRILLSSVPSGRPREGDALVVRGELPSPLDPPSGCRFRTRCPLASEVCARQDPPLREVSDGHVVACHHANRAAQIPALAAPRQARGA